MLQNNIEVPPKKITYVYQNVEEITQQTRFYGDEGENPIEFLRECERNMENICNNMLDKIRYNGLLEI